MQLEIRKTVLITQVAFGLSLILISASARDPLCASVVNASSGAIQTQGQSRKLNPVHSPDLSKLEPEVRDQLANLEKGLTAALKRSDLSDDELANGFGEAGRLYHAYSFTLAARDCYLNAIILAPRDFVWVYLLAKIDQQEGKTDDAIRNFSSAALLNPEYVPAQVNLGNIYLELNQTDKAELTFKKALTKDPANAGALYGLGQSALSQRRFGDAVSFFEKALQQVPEANRIHYSLALAYRGLGDLAKAESHLKQRGTVGVRVTDPLFDQLADLASGERLYLIRGQTALKANRLADAAAEFRKAIAAKPDSVGAHLNLGATLAQLNDLNGAISEFRTVIRLEPTNVNARFNLAVALTRQNLHTQAASELQALINIKPNDFAARFFLAKELLALNRRDEALDEFSRVTAGDPNNEEAVLQTANMLGQKAKYGEALNLVEKSYAQYPEKANTGATLAYLLATSPQIELRNGTRALELAQKIYKTSGLLQHGAVISVALAELGRCAEAADWQRKLITLAEEQQQKEQATKLRKDLPFFATSGSCRPGSE